MQQVGYYEEEDEPSEASDQQLTKKISNLIEMEENTYNNTQMSQDSTQMSQDSTQMTQEATQISQEEADRSHVQNVISERHASVKPKQTLTFTTDNAKDISKAIKEK